jgi:carboxyl-terminal processing protease
MISLVVVTAVITFSVTALAFFGWNYFSPSYKISFDSKKVSLENINKFNQVRKILETNFYQDVKEDTLLEGAVAGMAESLKDPYTVYFTKEQMQMFNEDIAGSYVGIGISISPPDENGLISVVEPFEGSPAQKAGVKQGDKIVKVDDRDVTGLKDENLVVNMIRGKEDTNVKITFYRPSEGRYIELEMVRKNIKIENIKSEVLPGGIGYIKLIKFDAEIANYFKDHLDKLLGKGIKGLIIDVRDNPGGRYDQVVAIADRLLPKGKIVYTEDKYKNQRIEYSDEKELNLPMVLLVNGNSASASEILAGALKDFKKGTLVGTKTFGKGLVQTDFLLNDGSGIKVTIARYFTPSGVCIQGIGIVPDVEVQLPDKYKNVPVSQLPRAEDSQLTKAVEVIKGQIQ